MQEILDSVSGEELGKRFLINLFDCLTAGHIDPSLAQEVISQVAAQNGRGPLSWATFLSQLGDLIFDNPDHFQFRGPITSNATAEWMTVKSLADVIDSMRLTSGISEPDLQAMLRLPTLAGPHTQIREDQAEFIAEMIGDRANGIEFGLARTFPNLRTGHPRAAPSWYSQWGNFASLDEVSANPSSALAGRLRDWLGLGHYRENHPLYLFRARAPFGATDLGGHRPTLFDGFDNKLYKHRCSDQFNQEMSGSAMDICKVRRAVGARRADLEGGPEIVSKGMMFSADRFLCQYVGKTPALNLDLDVDYIHALMLPPDIELREVVQRVAAALTGAMGGGR